MLTSEHDLRANAFRVCREGKPVSTFPDHADSGLFYFDERAGKILRMEKQHRLAVGADPWHAVAEHARALADELVARRDDVGHVIADVMDAAIGVALDEFGDRRGVAQRLDELDLGIGQRHEHGDYAVLRQRHGAGDFRAECAAIDFGRLLGVLDRDRDMISWVRPQLLIPVHGEALHLSEHAKLARTAGVPKVLICKNGDLVKLGPGDPGIIEEIPSGRLYKDGNILEDSKSRAVVERRRMGFAGCAFVAIAMTDKGELADDPEVDLVGIPEKNAAGEPLDDIVFDVVVSTVEGLPRARRRDADATAESVRRAVRAALNEHWGKKPICLVHVLTI